MIKNILASQKRNMYVLSRCKVMVKNGEVCYLNSDGEFYNIPQSNTVFVGLAEGTSITQEAVLQLSSSGVVLFWTKGGGYDIGCAGSPVSDYRPTKYMQSWCGFWFDESKRLKAAKLLQSKRIESLEEHTPLSGIEVDSSKVGKIIKNFHSGIKASEDIQQLLGYEGAFVRSIYGEYAKDYGIEFKRDHSAKDPYNKFVTLGNYYAYGIARSAVWVLGLNDSFPLFHGKTRRGGLVFDIADVIKTSITLPLAFEAADKGLATSKFKALCVKTFDDAKILSYLIDNLKEIIAAMEEECT